MDKLLLALLLCASIVRGQDGGPDPRGANELLELASGEAADGHFQAAESLVQEALLRGDCDRARALGLGLKVSWALGRYGAAHERMSELCVLLESAELAGDRTLDLWIETSRWAYLMGDWEDALEFGRRALAESARLEEPWGAVEAWKNISLVHEAAEDYEASLEASERALAQPLGPERAWKRAGVLINKGRVHRQLGQYELAATCFSGIGPAVEGTPFAIYLAMAEHGRIELELVQGKRAGPLLPRVAEVVECYRVDPYSGPRTILSGLELEARVRLTAGDLEGAQRVLTEAELLLDLPTERGLGSVASAGFRSRFTAFAELSQDLNARLDGELAAFDGLCAAARWKGRAILEEWASESDLAGTHRPDIEELRSALGPGGTLIEYAAGRSHLYAFVLEPGQELRRVDLGTKEEVFELAGSYLTHLEHTRSTVAQVASVGSKLHDRLITPLGLAQSIAQGAEERELVVVPCAELAKLPLCALVREAAPEAQTFAQLRFLIDDFVITYAPSVPILCWGSARAPRGQPGRALLLASHELDHTRREALAALKELLDPDEKRVLAEQLAELLLDERDELTTRRVDLRLGEHASRSALEGDLGQYSLIHIGSHASAHPTSSRKTYLEMAGGESLGLEDVRALSLNAELVVLSACSTARGPIMKGEGVQSLAAAVLHAGAHRVVATLWPVGDSAAADLMSRVYANALETSSDGLSLSGLPAALRSAQLELGRRPGRAPGVRPQRQGTPGSLRGSLDGHPSLWAAYLFVGTRD